MGTFYRSRHELIFAFKKGTEPHLNSFELGQPGRYRTNVWQYRCVNAMRAGRMMPSAKTAREATSRSGTIESPANTSGLSASAWSSNAGRTGLALA